MELPAENLADVIGRHAATAPGATAIVDADRTIDYGTFDSAIWRAAAWFRSRGVAPGAVVGLAMGNSALHLVAVYALARLGAIQLPLSSTEPPASQQALLDRFRAAAVFGDADAAPAWLTGGGASDDALRARGGDMPWKILFTSGTTGKPRAVLQTHAMHITWREVAQSTVPLVAGDRYLAAVELKFVAGILRCMNTFRAGGAVILRERDSRPEAVLRDIDRSAATYLYLPASWLHPLLGAVPAQGPAWPRVRFLRTGSMVASRRLRDEVRTRLTPNLTVTYGTNDSGTPLTVAGPELLERHPDTLGTASPGVTLQIVDDRGHALPAGEVGHLRIRAPGLPSSYIDDPQASAQAFRDGWFYPGDLGLLSSDGLLFFRGRSDERMNYSGIKIYPSEIEAVLLEHPAVAEAAAFPVSSEKAQDLPAAAVVLRPGAKAPSLLKWCRRRLGAHAPVVVMSLGQLPRNERGKVLKKELAAQAAGAIERARKPR